MTTTDTTAAEWMRCERISDVPAVHEALCAFIDNSTADNSTMIVREILDEIKFAELQRDAERFNWIAENYDEFCRLQEQNLNDGIGLLNALDERVEAARLYAGNQALIAAGVLR